MLDEVEDEDVEGVVVPDEIVDVADGRLFELEWLVGKGEEEVVDEDEEGLVALDGVVDEDVEGIVVIE